MHGEQPPGVRPPNRNNATARVLPAYLAWIWGTVYNGARLHSHLAYLTLATAGNQTIHPGTPGTPRTSSDPVVPGGPANAAGEGDDPDPASSRTASACDDDLPEQPTHMSSSPQGLSVSLHLEVQDIDPAIEGYVDVLLRQAGQRLDIQAGQVTVAIVDDAAMTQLHQQYKNSPTTTDVLTFDLREDQTLPLDGDIAVCIDQATRLAKEKQHPVREEVLLYAIHGLLHMVGYDDQNDDAFAIMHEKEDQLLIALGVGKRFNK